MVIQGVATGKTGVILGEAVIRGKETTGEVIKGGGNGRKHQKSQGANGQGVNREKEVKNGLGIGGME